MKAEDANAEHMRATVEIDAWIRTRRQQVRSEDTLIGAMSGRGTIEESGALYRLARPVLERYERHLAETDTVDHEGTILNAWQYLRDGAVTPPWKAILIDEYQDVNPAQAAFVHALLAPREPGRASTRARLTAVGDDWQAIFSFQGGDVDLIRQFNDPAGAHEGVTERIELRQTYRFRPADRGLDETVRDPWPRRHRPQGDRGPGHGTGLAMAVEHGHRVVEADSRGNAQARRTAQGPHGRGPRRTGEDR